MLPFLFPLSPSVFPLYVSYSLHHSRAPHCRPCVLAHLPAYPYVDDYLETIKKSHAGYTHAHYHRIRDIFSFTPIVNGKSCWERNSRPDEASMPHFYNSILPPPPLSNKLPFACKFVFCPRMERSGFILHLFNESQFPFPPLIPLVP